MFFKQTCRLLEMVGLNNKWSLKPNRLNWRQSIRRQLLVEYFFYFKLKIIRHKAIIRNHIIPHQKMCCLAYKHVSSIDFFKDFTSFKKFTSTILKYDHTFVFERINKN